MSNLETSEEMKTLPLIFQKLEEEEKMLEQIFKEIEILEERLSPVVIHTEPSSDCPKNEDAPVEPTQSELHQRIDRIQRTTKSVQRRIISLREKVNL